jgi:multiple sugar transport system ATP-binding protein
MIYVTHDQVEAMTMANKIVVMKDGKVQQIGSPMNLYNYPVNKFVAGFIGSPPMNFLTVKVSERNGSVVLDEGSFELKPLPQHAEYIRNYAGKEIFFGIRPEDMSFVENPVAENNISAKVTVVEPLGADIHLWLTTTGSAAQQMVARTEPHYTFKVGDTTNFTPRLEKARYFDKETELSILAKLDAEAIKT